MVIIIIVKGEADPICYKEKFNDSLLQKFYVCNCFWDIIEYPNVMYKNVERSSCTGNLFQRLKNRHELSKDPTVCE